MIGHFFKGFSHTCHVLAVIRIRKGTNGTDSREERKHEQQQCDKDEYLGGRVVFQVGRWEGAAQGCDREEDGEKGGDTLN